MKEIKYWTFELDNGSNYSYLTGKYTSLDKLKYCLEKSEALNSLIYSLHNTHNLYIDRNDIKKVTVKISNIRKDRAFLEIYGEGKAKIKVKVGETEEIKEPGKPYIPSKCSYEEREIDISELKYRTTTYLETIYLNGIPTHYGETIKEKDTVING